VFGQQRERLIDRGWPVIVKRWILHVVTPGEDVGTTGSLVHLRTTTYMSQAGAMFQCRRLVTAGPGAPSRSDSDNHRPQRVHELGIDEDGFVGTAGSEATLTGKTDAVQGLEFAQKGIAVLGPAWPGQHLG
jgi:hypothetical protein